jgi:hypothetical protein
MRLSTLFMFFMAFVPIIIAQDNAKVKEIGVITSDFSNAGIIYKAGTERALWRVGILEMSGNKRTSESGLEGNLVSASNLNVQFSVKAFAGREKVNHLTNKLTFRVGADLSFQYSDSKSKLNSINNSYQDINYLERESSSKRYEPGINGIAGITYEFEGPISFGVEWNPYFRYTIIKQKSDEEKATVKNYGYGIFEAPLQFQLTLRLK